MAHTIEDLPHGPLDIYRKKASFNWKDMLLFLEGEEISAMKVTFLNFEFKLKLRSSNTGVKFLLRVRMGGIKLGPSLSNIDI